MDPPSSVPQNSFLSLQYLRKNDTSAPKLFFVLDQRHCVLSSVLMLRVFWVQSFFKEGKTSANLLKQ